MLETNKIYNMDCVKGLKLLDDESINCIVTSPPYWNLRNYNVEGQLGLEETFGEYITKLCNIFDEVKRVLRKDGTVFVNLGDCYAGEMGKKSGWTDNKLGFERQEAIDKCVCLTKNNKIIHELPQKCLVQIPHRFAIEMTNRGWLLRNTIIWHKPNCMPSSTTDRFTVNFEYVFFFTKNKKYWFEQQREPLKLNSIERDKYLRNNPQSKYGQNPFVNGQPIYRKGREDIQCNTEGRNKRAVWQITTKPFSESHFAVFPEELVETPIKAGCPKYICKKCGFAKKKIIQSDNPSKEFMDWDDNRMSGAPNSFQSRQSIKSLHRNTGGVYSNAIFKGWEVCQCNTDFEGGIVLDPFIGSGTTALVSLKLGRRFIGFELSEAYCKIANKRIEGWLQQKPLPIYNDTHR